MTTVSFDTNATHKARGGCAIIRCMRLLFFSTPEPEPIETAIEEDSFPLRTLGLATVLLGAVTLGLFLGRELRFRYKFRRRTPSDFFSNAGDPIANAEYGMGV